MEQRIKSREFAFPVTELQRTGTRVGYSPSGSLLPVCLLTREYDRYGWFGDPLKRALAVVRAWLLDFARVGADGACRLEAFEVRHLRGHDQAESSPPPEK